MARQKNLKLYYIQFKESRYYYLSIYSGMIIVSIAVGLFGLLPLVQNVLNINQQVADIQSSIATLQTNTSYLSGLDENQLDNQYALARNSVLTSVDFASIVQSIEGVAIQSHVTLSDFNINAEDIGKGTQPKLITDAGGSGSYTVDVGVAGTQDDIVTFIKNIKQALPLMSSIKFNYQNSAATVTVSVALQPQIPQNVDLTTQHLLISPQMQTLLTSFGQWELNNSVDNTTPVAASTSAGSVPPF